MIVFGLIMITSYCCDVLIGTDTRYFLIIQIDCYIVPKGWIYCSYGSCYTYGMGMECLQGNIFIDCIIKPQISLVHGI